MYLKKGLKYVKKQCFSYFIEKPVKIKTPELHGKLGERTPLAAGKVQDSFFEKGPKRGGLGPQKGP